MNKIRFIPTTMTILNLILSIAKTQCIIIHVKIVNFIQKLPKLHQCILVSALAYLSLILLISIYSSKTTLYTKTDQKNYLSQSIEPNKTFSFKEKNKSSLQNQKKWQTVRVKYGDNLSTLFHKKGIKTKYLLQIIKTPKFGKKLTNISAGKSLDFQLDSHNNLIQLRYNINNLNQIIYTQSVDKTSYSAEYITLTPKVKLAFTQINIQKSLFIDSAKAGLTNKQSMEIAQIFNWQLDFSQDLRLGDQIKILYRQKYLGNKKIGTGKIVTATMINQGKQYTAIYYKTDKGEGYYSLDGKNLKKSFLRRPVNLTRISSKFNPHRLHPIFKTKRPHLGVDYAAPKGSPIKASSDGKITFSGWKRGYGNVIFIKHPDNITTVYAHQYKINKSFKQGSNVKQGDVIGYVGSSGWATGPHLHYEFRIKGVPHNPETVELPNAKSITKSQMPKFQALANKMVAIIDSQPSHLALAP